MTGFISISLQHPVYLANEKERSFNKSRVSHSKHPQGAKHILGIFFEGLTVVRKKLRTPTHSDSLCNFEKRSKLNNCYA